MPSARANIAALYNLSTLTVLQSESIAGTRRDHAARTRAAQGVCEATCWMQGGCELQSFKSHAVANLRTPRSAQDVFNHARWPQGMIGQGVAEVTSSAGEAPMARHPTWPSTLEDPM